MNDAHARYPVRWVSPAGGFPTTPCFEKRHYVGAAACALHLWPVEYYATDPPRRMGQRRRFLATLNAAIMVSTMVDVGAAPTLCS
ncbi:MAG TPA: hypothetical protein VGF38_04135 [Ktedonobacterales bacterium]